MVETLTTPQVKKMKVAELRQALKDRGLSTAGLKAVLAERLLLAINYDGTPKAPEATATVPTTTNPSIAAQTPPAKAEPSKAVTELDTENLEVAQPETGKARDAEAMDAAPSLTRVETRQEEPQEARGPKAVEERTGLMDAQADEAAKAAEDPQELKVAETPEKREEMDDASEAPQAKRARTTPNLSASFVPPNRREDNQRNHTQVDTKAAEIVVEPTDPGQATEALRIDNFVRPFIQKHAQQLVEEHGGSIPVKGFWMDQIKTHCYAVFETQENAEHAQQALDGLKWPETGRNLRARFVPVDEAWSFINGTAKLKPSEPAKVPSTKAGVAPQTDVSLPATHPTGPDSQAKSSEHSDRRVREDKSFKRGAETLESLFKKTAAKPSIYWLPLTKRQIEDKKRQADRRARDREQPMPNLQARRNHPPPSRGNRLDDGYWRGRPSSYRPRGGYGRPVDYRDGRRF
mmetsp:Transcript_1404/g.4879  ORF Transcript_1404/g.4879 Transcript_1404/m.4879 type:complete len:462 (-) Transcript_1404:1507-2892(-)